MPSCSRKGMKVTSEERHAGVDLGFIEIVENHDATIFVFAQEPEISRPVQATRSGGLTGTARFGGEILGVDEKGVSCQQKEGFGKNVFHSGRFDAVAQVCAVHDDLQM